MLHGIEYIESLIQQSIMQCCINTRDQNASHIAAKSQQDPLQYKVSIQQEQVIQKNAEAIKTSLKKNPAIAKKIHEQFAELSTFMKNFQVMPEHEINKRKAELTQDFVENLKKLFSLQKQHPKNNPLYFSPHHNTEKSRKDSYELPSSEYTIHEYIKCNKSALAQAGFVNVWQDSYPDIVQCYNCEEFFYNWQTTSDIKAEHVRFKSNCRHMRQEIYNSASYIIEKNSDILFHVVNELVKASYSDSYIKKAIEFIEKEKQILILQYCANNTDYLEQAVLFSLIKFITSRVSDLPEEIQNSFLFGNSEFLDKNKICRINKTLKNIFKILNWDPDSKTNQLVGDTQEQSDENTQEQPYWWDDGYDYENADVMFIRHNDVSA